MLVLSRRPNERILFPNLGISVQVIRVAGKAVRLGIDAPPDIRVAREEILSSDDEEQDISPLMSRQWRHALRNRLNTASLGLQVLHRRLETGQIEDVEATIFKIFHELHEIDAELDMRKRSEAEQRPARGRRALVVEDNANERELLAEYLRMSGYQVDTVRDGRAAIEFLKTRDTPDAVLLDMNMPRMNGPEMVTSIRCEPQWRALKLYAVSGADRRELDLGTGDRGVDRWFSKPVNVRALVGEMNRDLDDSLVLA